MEFKPRFIDIGSNLMDSMFVGVYRKKKKHISDLNLVLERARGVGVDKIICTNTNKRDFTNSRSLVIENDFVYRTIGVHPTSSLDFEKDKKLFSFMEEEVKKHEKEKIVAVGECGLDYDRTNFCPKEIQLKYFPLHFSLAKKTNLPLFLHDRNTNGEMADIVLKHRSSFTNAVVHSFTGTKEELKKYLKMGIYIGVNGCSLKTKKNLEVIKSIPLDRIMLETDAPWCRINPSHASFKFVKTHFDTVKTPEKFVLGKCVKTRNEPCQIIQVAEVLSEVMEVSLEDIVKNAYENTKKVFFT